MRSQRMHTWVGHSKIDSSLREPPFTLCIWDLQRDDKTYNNFCLHETCTFQNKCCLLVATAPYAAGTMWSHFLSVLEVNIVKIRKICSSSIKPFKNVQLDLKTFSLAPTSWNFKYMCTGRTINSLHTKTCLLIKSQMFYFNFTNLMQSKLVF